MLLRCIRESQVAGYLNEDGVRTALYSARVGKMYRPLALCGKDISGAGGFELSVLIRADFSADTIELSFMSIRHFEVMDNRINAEWRVHRMDGIYFHLGDEVTKDLELMYSLLTQHDLPLIRHINRVTSV